MNRYSFDSIEDSLEAIARGEIVIVLDDEDRENEGDFLMAAELVSDEAINFMASVGRGLICAPITSKRAQELNLPPMVQDNTSSHETAFTVSIDAAEHITTGISTADRALTIQLLTQTQTKAADFVRPGHIFPLKAKDGGVLERAGHTEAAVDLAQLAGLYPAGVICEIMNPDGTMARLPELMELAQQYHLKILTIQDLIIYRQQRKKNNHSTHILGEHHAY